MSQPSSLVRPASDDALAATSSRVNLSRNTSVISTVSSSSSLDVPPLQTRSHLSDTFLHTPEPKGRPPAWLSKRFNRDADDNGGTQTPRAAASPAPTANGAARMSSPDGFEFGEEIGGGSWSIVVDATHKSTGKHYAIKILNKAQLIKEKMVQSASAEKNALATLRGGNHPGIIALHSAFQDSTSLYFVLSLAPNGDLRELVKSVGSFSVDCARYYAATIVDTVQWMHSKGVLHRDLKPENILLDADMRIKLADFGSAYVSETLDLSPRTSTFVGTAAYVSPELLSGPQKVTSLSSDLWALGCVIYFLLVGQSPFLALTDYLSFKKIEKLDYTFMEGFDVDARDLIQRLIVTDPASRLGTPPKSSPQELRDHPFFIGRGSQGPDLAEKYINWQSLWSDPPARIESGLVHPPLPLPGDDKLANGLAWVDFINEFSVISLDQDRPEASPATPRVEIADEELYPEDPRTPVAPTFGDKLNTVVPTIGVVDASTIPVINGNGNNNFTNEKLDDKETLKTITPIDTKKPPASLRPEELKIVNDHSWSLILLPQETIFRVAKVEVKTGRRPFQRTDQRILAFTTSPRLLCVKARHSLTGNGTLVLKQEFLFPTSPVDRPGKRVIKVTTDNGGNLILETPEKSYTYRILIKTEAQSWCQHIQELLR